MITHKNPRTYARIRKSPPGCPRGVKCVFRCIQMWGTSEVCSIATKKRMHKKREGQLCPSLKPNQTKQIKLNLVTH
jgi:hypothetical protein